MENQTRKMDMEQLKRIMSTSSEKLLFRGKRISERKSWQKLDLRFFLRIFSEFSPPEQNATTRSRWERDVKSSSSSRKTRQSFQQKSKHTRQWNGSVFSWPTETNSPFHLKDWSERVKRGTELSQQQQYDRCSNLESRQREERGDVTAAFSLHLAVVVPMFNPQRKTRSSHFSQWESRRLMLTQQITRRQGRWRRTQNSGHIHP